MSAYFYRDSSGREIGPLERDALAKLRQAGILDNNTLVRSETSSGWELLREAIPPLSAPQPPQQIAKKSFNWMRVGLLIAAGIVVITWRFDHRYAVAAERAFRQEVEPQAKLVSFRVTDEHWLSEPKSNFERYELKFEAEVEFGKDKSLPGDLRGERLDLGGHRVKLSGTMLATKEKTLRHQDPWNVDTSELRVVGASDSPLFSKLKASSKAADDTSMRNACINNLRLLDSAKQQWALENRKRGTDTPTWDDLRAYLERGAPGNLPTCPQGGVYTIGPVETPPTCSIPGHVLP
ncbi:MAG: hypothetical protein ABSH38_05220 [Verrucomicrobiota bacterium]|jgi:hypothetical protein